MFLSLWKKFNVFNIGTLLYKGSLKSFKNIVITPTTNAINIAEKRYILYALALFNCMVDQSAENEKLLDKADRLLEIA